MKGIVLAGGTGTRLHPATLSINKQLLPVYDKPMIYYPVSVLMLAGIREILIISSPEHLDNYKRLFGTGEQFGLHFTYAIQPRPEGLAQAFIIGRDFIGTDDVALVLGDNLFFGNGMSELLGRARERKTGATVFAYHVDNPAGLRRRHPGQGRPPLAPRGEAARAREPLGGHRPVLLRQPGDRHRRRREALGAGGARDHEHQRSLPGAGRTSRGSGCRGAMPWLDTGTHDSLLEASEFVRTLQHRQGLQVACLEEIAYLQGFIGKDQLVARGKLFAKTAYGQNLLKLAQEDPDSFLNR